jgi:hypothetical protein
MHQSKNFGKEKNKRRNKNHNKGRKMESIKESNIHIETKRKICNTKLEYPTL